MNVKGIGMQPDNVLLILQLLKKQTRRLLKPQPRATEDGLITWKGGYGALDCFAASIHDDCWYGVEGDVLYVREPCRGYELTETDSKRLNLPAMLDGVKYWADDKFIPCEDSKAAADRWMDLYHYGSKRGHANRRGRMVPAIHAPRWTSRIVLELTHVRAEPLLDITEADARAEGKADVEEYLQLWDRLHGKGSHLTNPWVWVLEFRPHFANIDAWLAQRQVAAA
jgi:hypothetical protein